jgi:formylglycine-generating enzyme
MTDLVSYIQSRLIFREISMNKHPAYGFVLLLFFFAGFFFSGCRHGDPADPGPKPASAPDASSAADANNNNIAPPSSFDGARAGEEREIAGMKFNWAPAGKFIMGSPADEPERRPGEDQVEVTLSKGFWIAKYEATQADWKRIVGALPGPLTAELPEGDNLPVGNMSFAEAEDFGRKATDLARNASNAPNGAANAASVLPSGWEIRLPTEAQWEYAARAGTTTATAFGNSLNSQQANFKGDKPYNGGTAGPVLNVATPVGSYPPNAWGIHDMHGNIYEWVRDWFHLSLPGGVDPDLHDAMSTATRSEHGDISRSRRGGGWPDPGWPCRSAFRSRFEPERRYDHIGFRVVAVRL